MGSIKKPHKVKLLIGIIAQSNELILLAERVLQKSFGEIDYKSQIIRFDFTDYYEKEMGRNLLRRFISFKELITPSKLAKIKVLSNKIESKISKSSPGGNRKVNIDPGYINDAKLVLASVKDFSHRIYLSKGIYSEVTLQYRDRSFRYYDWTYPDYRTDEYLKIFHDIRALYMKQR
ncbi:DUF4416 family protein [Candidatus Omnitrophota bacterium]